MGPWGGEEILEGFLKEAIRQEFVRNGFYPDLCTLSLGLEGLILELHQGRYQPSAGSFSIQNGQCPQN
jgi:hypothetical protein